jgi:phosphatidate cytidylyltransferase
MALNREVFRTRALSSLFFVIIMLAGLLLNHWSFLLLFTIIHFGCWREYLRLLEKIYSVSFSNFLKVGFAVSGYAIMLAFCGPVFRVADYGLKENFCFPLAVAGFILMVIGIFQKSTNLTPRAIYVAIIGYIYISISWGMMMLLRQDSMAMKGSTLFVDFGRIFPMLLVLAIWANDTFSYLVGSFIGKTPFSKISPKKTWEGTLGGFLLCIIGMGTLGSLMVTGKMSWQAAAIGAVAGFFGTLGDLLESKLKRMADVKDSGTMLPGHGGFMDRFDSLLIATPMVWLLVMLWPK